MCIITAAALCGCAKEQSVEQKSETRLLLDTYCTITIYDSADSTLLDEAFDLCAQYEALFSITIEGSDVWRINHAMGAPVEVDPQTVELILSGLSFGELSGGLFDITIGRLSRLWDFSGEQYLPSDEELEEACKTIDYTQVRIVENTVQLLDPDAWIDLGAVAKGHIADKIAGFLVARGITAAVIDLGGDIAAIGQKPDGEPWRIGIRKPQGGTNELLGVAGIGESSIVSSGIYERKFERDGVTYHHILDPGTGKPVLTDVVSVTILADSAVTGEGLSTIILLIGSDRAQEIFNSVSGFTGALLVLENGDVLEFGDIDMRWID